MRKKFLSALLISSFFLTPILRADTPAIDSTTPPPVAPPVEHVEQPQMTTAEPAPEQEEGTPVSEATQDSGKAARKKRWQNIALAAGAVVVAVVAMILVANNDGHKDKHKH